MSALRIDDCKAELTKPAFLALLAHAIYNPTPERLAARAAAYQSDSEVLAYGAWQGTEPVGVIVLRNDPQETEIQNIAVAPQARGTGAGRAMIGHAHNCLISGSMIAETDDDAVDFYRACGFQVESLGEKYPGIVRYRCVLGGV